MKTPALFLLFLLSFSTILYAQDRYINEKYGFSIEKPKDWLILTHQDLSNDLNIRHGQYLITFYKYAKEADQKVNPTINIHLRPNKYKTFKRLFREHLYDEKWKYNRPGFDYKDTTSTIVEKNGVKTIYNNATYLIINENKESLNVETKSHLFFSRKYLCTIKLYTNQKNKAYDQIFESLVQSIKIAND